MKTTSNRLSIPEQHQLKIAQRTLRMNDVMIAVMGGMTKAEAVKIIQAAKDKSKNPANSRSFFPC